MEDLIEDPRTIPAHKPVVERLVRPIGRWSIPPLQAVPDDIDDPADHSRIIHSRNAVRKREIRFDSVHLPTGQHEYLTHGQSEAHLVS